MLAWCVVIKESVSGVQGKSETTIVVPGATQWKLGGFLLSDDDSR
jgi:hypothetical protein